MSTELAFTNVYNKGRNNNKDMTREEFIEKAKELATDFWTMNLRDGSYESKFTELLDKYEAKSTDRKLKVLDKLHGFHNE